MMANATKALCPARWLHRLWVCACVLGLAAGVARAETDPLDAPFVTVEFGEADTIRGLVGRHLNDPDLWPVVLRLNNIGSPADLLPGMALRLPVQQVKAADAALTASLTAIQSANAEGARIFAPDEIGQAIDNRDQAITQREEGSWRQVVSFAGVASDLAREALEISVAQRDRSAEAIVSDVQGSVEGRAPADPRWSDRDLNDILVEFERVRTLTASTTQITFRDLSKLRLNPNSNATIQRMRSDPLTGSAVTKVSLANGDFYALLNQLNDKTEFQIEMAGVETQTNSGDFWIKTDETGARFVNYDRRDLSIDTGDDRIEVGEKEGVVLGRDGAQRAAVLDSVLLSGPPPGEVIYSGVAPLEWQAFEGAVGYWLEIATDPGFNQMQISEWDIRDTGFRAEALPPARYHWRVAALDKLGLPGTWSTPQDFTIRIDNTPPFLTLLAPNPGAIVTAPEVEVLGATELNTALRLNGTSYRAGSDGSFVQFAALVPGENTITVEATDPAGNTSTRSVSVVYRPTQSVDITLDDTIPRVGSALATREAELSVAARTTAQPDAPVVVSDDAGDVVSRSVVSADGQILFTVPVDAAARGYEVRTLAPDGTAEGRLSFTALRDSTAPEIQLDIPPPRATGEDRVALSGSVGDAVSVALNGAPVDLAEGRFDLVLELQPGVNEFNLTARDAVGNVSATLLQTLLDLDPPDIAAVSVERPQGEGGPIEIMVQASDASGLRQAAPFLIRVGEEEIEGFLRCDSVSGVCSVSLPPAPGALDLLEIIIEDYAGNAAYR